MSDRLQQLSLFIRAVETGNFSEAARQSGVSQPSVSRNIAELENRLGVKLLLRTTRKVALTDAGRAFFKRTKDILDGLDEAESAARGADNLSGSLRVALPVTFGVREIAPLLRPFLDQHPLLRLDLLMADQFEDLVAKGVDVALRLGKLPSSTYLTRKLGRAKRLLVASPDYLARHGNPAKVGDIARHSFIRGPTNFDAVEWSYGQMGAEGVVKIDGRVRVSSAIGMVACAVEGLGIALVSIWMCRAELETGRLLPILTDHALDPVEAFAVFPGGRQQSSKARAFANYLSVSLRST
ncbi:LysR family transcriptional regulator [Bradyrhizobium lablabi]|uniref:LysR family transcriptional regulator n=1 Tax=Bradyrhizobium lablabi TaxID=722472 RepID=UPI001BAADFDF|nr:LysR family transcriptional regulator [Bradyrhizobium lablabi]MBR0695640.1 LysR family transcriptional regulator [Bradyrhizobium lablabi]